MRKFAWAVFAIAISALAGPAAAQTFASGYPVCLHVYGPAAYYDCSHTSMGECE
jgi:hypothetical protein